MKKIDEKLEKIKKMEEKLWKFKKMQLLEKSQKMEKNCRKLRIWRKIGEN